MQVTLRFEKLEVASNVTIVFFNASLKKYLVEHHPFLKK